MNTLQVGYIVVGLVVGLVAAVLAARDDEEAFSIGIFFVFGAIIWPVLVLFGVMWLIGVTVQILAGK